MDLQRTGYYLRNFVANDWPSPSGKKRSETFGLKLHTAGEFCCEVSRGVRRIFRFSRSKYPVTKSQVFDFVAAECCGVLERCGTIWRRDDSVVGEFGFSANNI